jgi:type IV pilus assembly protein PilA
VVVVKKMTGFSLIELLVVIAILGVLAAIAVPVYTQYRLKTKIASSMVIMQAAMNDIQNTYSKTGSFPATMTVNGTSIAFWTVTNISNVYSMFYAKGSDGLGARIGVNLTGLDGIPSYISPTVAAPSNYSAFFMGIRDVNGAIKIVCGQNDPAYLNQNIPLAYLPANCKCTTVNNYTNNGSGGC